MSIYASIPGVGAEDDDPDVGRPQRYLGSHILPGEDDPRGPVIGLALIPSHITRDGRDDRPDNGAPWPWLRLSLDRCGDDPTVVLNPVQARHLAELLNDWADSTSGDGPHRYLSTGCLHGDAVLPDGRTGHQYCQSDTGKAGAKKPAQCKFCAAPCVCPCHRQPDPVDATLES